jgi:ABC-type phosphate/phosphonate transport system substrate-binding protein
MIVVMKLLAGRTQDLADVEAIVSSGANREVPMAAVRQAAPDRVATLQQLFANVDRHR